MTFAFSYDVPGNRQMYAAVKTEIGQTAPDGLIAQLVIDVEHGLRHLMVWTNQDDWERFRTDRVEPAVRKVLAAAGHSAPATPPHITALELVDIWIPSPVPADQP